MIELLSPAGDLEKLRIAFHYGADAVYFGGQDFGLRANAKNFSREDIKEATKLAHKLGKRVYVTVNIIFHDEDFTGLEDYLTYLDQINVDAIMVSDVAVLALCNDLKLKLERYISTQTSVLNHEAALFYKSLGASRIVLAREALKDDIIKIKARVGLELEAFTHGAMCTAFSGKCILSNYVTNRDANRGGCAQICRWHFKAYHPKSGELIAPDYQMAPKDLNMIPYFKEMIESGINSFKIEGRMRSIYYIATVLHTYRAMLSRISNNCLTPAYTNYYLKVLNRCANRESVPQFFKKLPGVNEQYYLSGEDEQSNQDFLGIVLENKNGVITLEQRNHFRVGDQVEFFGPNIEIIKYEVKDLYDEKMQPITVAPHAQMIVKIKAEMPLEPYDIMRCKTFDIC